MKKSIISLFSLILFLFVTNGINACETCGCQNNLEITSDVNKSTTKSKICDKSACDKSKKTCCKSNKKSSCSKSSNNGFDFSKKNSYSKTKKCCKSKTKSSCSKKANLSEKETTEEINDKNELSEKI